MKKEDFQCKCGCGQVKCDSRIFDFIAALGRKAMKFNISSGFRCIKHNADVGGVPTSQHIRGVAVDVHVSEKDYYEFLQVVLEHGLRALPYPWGFHVDCGKGSDIKINVFA